jgi:hypothetical protein
MQTINLSGNFINLPNYLTKKDISKELVGKVLIFVPNSAKNDINHITCKKVVCVKVKLGNNPLVYVAYDGIIQLINYEKLVIYEEHSKDRYPR